MARDTENKKFYHVGIPKDSETFRELISEARESGLPIARVIAMRTALSYRIEKLLTTGGRGGHLALSEPIDEPVDESDSEADEDYSQADANADAALDYWG